MRHLRCFLAVAKMGSVTRAAESMGTVQPSVSRSIKELEEELGCALFERSSNGLILNGAGQVLLSHVQSGLGQVDMGLKTLRGLLSEQKVSAYILPNVIRLVMPGAAARFKSLYPNIDLEFLATIGGGLHKLLQAGNVDFGFGRLLAAEHMQGLNFEHLFSEPLVFFVRAGHPLDGSTDLTIEDLDRYPVVLPTQNTIIRAEIDRFIIAKGLSRFSNQIETLSFEFARNFLHKSDAVICHPLNSIRREVTEGSVKILDYCVGEMMGAVGLTTPARQQVREPAQLLMQVIREEVDRLGLSQQKP